MILKKGKPNKSGLLKKKEKKIIQILYHLYTLYLISKLVYIMTIEHAIKDSKIKFFNK